MKSGRALPLGRFARAANHVVGPLLTAVRGTKFIFCVLLWLIAFLVGGGEGGGAGVRGRG